MIELSRDEAIATAKLASFISGALNSIGEMSTGSSRNITDGRDIDVNSILSQFTITAPPKPPGPVIEGLAVDREDKEVVLHPVEQPNIIDEPVRIENPFAKQATMITSNKPVIPLNPNGKSPIASFLKKEATSNVEATPIPTQTLPDTPELNEADISKNNVASLIYEKLVSIELKLKTIQTSIKKLNENKSSKG
jgi:hypothetical protein